MKWVPIIRYIIARTKEPSIVHRGVAAIGSFIAALSLSGPEKWVALIVSGSAIIGILIPDTVEPKSQGYNDASQDMGEAPTTQPERAGTDVAPQNPVLRWPGAGAECSHSAADGVRQPVPSVDYPIGGSDDTYPNLPPAGFGDRD